MYISNKVIYDKDGNLRELEVSVIINDQSVKLSQFSDGNLRNVLREFLLKETLISKEENDESRNLHIKK